MILYSVLQRCLLPGRPFNDHNFLGQMKLFSSRDIAIFRHRSMETLNKNIFHRYFIQGTSIRYFNQTAHSLLSLDFQRLLHSERFIYLFWLLILVNVYAIPIPDDPTIKVTKKTSINILI